MSNGNEDRKIEIKEGNYIEYLKGNYIQNNYIKVDKIRKPIGFPQNIPRSSTDKFVGRQKELETLHQQLQDKEEVTIAHLEGMGGIGKTELAIIYSLINLQCNTYPGGICWLRCREEDIGLQIVLFCRKYLDLKPPEDLELADQVAWCWQNWREGNTFIVFDDVTDYRKINPFLPPQSSQFKVLITTRLKLKLPSPLYLEVLSESEALELLTQLVGSEKVNQEPEIAKLLCKRLGYLPLAIQLVGQYIEEYEISLTEEIKRLEGKGLNDSSLSIEEDDSTWTSDIKGVKAAFELSWQELNESAQKLGCWLSLFALAPIPWSLVESAAVNEDQEELKKARVNLKRLHLLQNEDNYQLHQLIQEFFRDKQNHLNNTEKQKRNFCTAIVAIANNIPQALTLEDVNYFTPMIPHLAETANVYQNWLSDQDLIELFMGLGRFYQGQGLYEQAFPWCEQYLSVAKECLGEEHPYVATSLNNLATLYHNQGRYEEAESLYLQALGIYKKLLGEEHPDVVLSLNNLATLYHNQGRYEEAESLYLQALGIYKKLLGEEHPDVVLSLNNLATLYHDQKRYEEAEVIYLTALELNKKILREENFNLAAYLAEDSDMRGSMLINIFSFNQTRNTEKENLTKANTLNNLALLYEEQGRYSEAKTLYLQALEISEQILGVNHPSTEIVQENLTTLENKYTPLFEESKKSFQVSILHPRRLAKGYSSTITVQIYLSYKRPEAVSKIKQLQQLDSSELIENRYTALIPEQTVIIQLSSPAINFLPDEVLKELRGEYVNRVTFTAKPDNGCAPGRQAAVLSIRDSKTNEEYESIPCFFIIDDFAFDHVSKPILSYVSSGVTSIGSLALFTLSFLEKVDATLGIPVGTAGAALALLFGLRPKFLYKNDVKTEGK